MQIPTWAVILALAIAIFLIVKKTAPAYALIAGAFIGGFAGTCNVEAVVGEMIAGVKDISPAVLRVLAAGVLAGALIKTNSASKIAFSSVSLLGERNALLSLIIAAFILTASGVFIDVAVLTAAPIALEIARKARLNRLVILLALVGGGKSGNVISPNPNTISAAANFDAPLSNVMCANIPAAIIGIAATFIILKFATFRGEERVEIGVETPGEAKLPSLFAALSGPIFAVVLLMARPVFGVAIDPVVALPAGGILCAICARRARDLGECARLGLEKMAPVAVLLIATGTLAGIIKASNLKSALLNFMDFAGISDIFIAPVSGALMSGASASTTAGAVIASSTFASVIKAAGISAVWGAAMVNAGATVLDHLPHGSFFHVTAGAVELKFSKRLKLVLFESLIGTSIAASSTISCIIFEICFN